MSTKLGQCPTCTRIIPIFCPMTSLTPPSIHLSFHHACSVSLESAANYDKDRHLGANFNDVSTKTKSFLSRLRLAWPGKQFQEIILDCKIGTLRCLIFFILVSNVVKMCLANISTFHNFSLSIFSDSQTFGARRHGFPIIGSHPFSPQYFRRSSPRASWRKVAQYTCLLVFTVSLK